MGGDHAPGEIVKGAALAATEYGIDISLVGIPASVHRLLDRHPRLQLVPCTQVVAMDEHPAHAVRNKPDSSMSVCARMCRMGQADGWVSAGNSGAVMAAALFIQGRIRGIERPALGSIVPTQNGFAYFLDVGANVDSKPEYLAQFAAMGVVYAREIRDRIDWREFGGAPLLGIDGVAVVAHGRSDARAMKNAIRVTRDAVENGLVGKIRAEVGKA